MASRSTFTACASHPASRPLSNVFPLSVVPPLTAPFTAVKITSCSSRSRPANRLRAGPLSSGTSSRGTPARSCSRANPSHRVATITLAVADTPPRAPAEKRPHLHTASGLETLKSPYRLHLVRSAKHRHRNGASSAYSRVLRVTALAPVELCTFPTVISARPP